MAGPSDEWPRVFSPAGRRVQIAGHAAYDADLPPRSRGVLVAQLTPTGPCHVLVEEMDVEFGPYRPGDRGQARELLEEMAACEGTGPVTDDMVEMSGRLFIFSPDELTRLPAGLVDPPVWPGHPRHGRGGAGRPDGCGPIGRRHGARQEAARPFAVFDR